MNPNAEGYLLAVCQSLGWVWSSGFGPVPLPWAEIRAFADCTHQIAEAWEFEAVRGMSVAYLIGLDSDVDPAVNGRYAGLLLPLVMPRDPTVAKVMRRSFGQ